IGQTMTMVLAIKDDENKFDMLVRNCVAHDGKRAPIQLVDQYGCVVRPKIMSKFQKIKNFGPSASVVSFAYFQAFKFPDSMNVHFQCVIQVCRYNCPEPKCGHEGLLGGGGLGDHGLNTEYGPPPASVLGGSLGGEYGPPPAFPDPRHPSGPAGAYSEKKHDIVPAPQAQTSSSTSGLGDHGLNTEYGPPPASVLGGSLGGEYGPPPAFPDPRHPSGPAGAYSEKKHDIVPAPQAQTSSSTSPPSGPQVNEDDIHLPPPPPPPGHHHGQYVKRKSDIEGEFFENNLATLGGRPRSVENLHTVVGARRRRSVEHPETFNIVVNHVYKREAQEMTDVNTSRIIQVVAPGDVNFA
nr:dusky-like protein [Cucujiformia]